MTQGTDIDWFEDLNPHGRVVTGVRAVEQAIYHRLITPADSVPGRLGYGFDLRALLNEDGTSRTPFQIAAAIESQALQEERVASVTVTVTSLPRENQLRVELSGECAEGPFELVLAVSDLTVKRLL